MIKITTEDIVSSLLALRFERIDKLLYLVVSAKLTLGKDNENKFVYIHEEYSDFFNYYIESDNLNFKLKDGYRLSSDTSDGYTIYGRLKNKNKELMGCLESIDFRDIIINKISILCNECNKVNEYSTLFCDKEKDVIADMFGIKQMYNGYVKGTNKSYIRIYEQEEKDNDRAVLTLKRILEKREK